MKNAQHNAYARARDCTDEYIYIVHRSVDLTYRIAKINRVIRGWINYFELDDIKSLITRIDQHLRVLMIVIIRKQWKVRKKREWRLRKLGVSPNMSYKVGGMDNR